MLCLKLWFCPLFKPRVRLITPLVVIVSGGGVGQGWNWIPFLDKFYLSLYFVSFDLHKGLTQRKTPPPPLSPFFMDLNKFYQTHPCYYSAPINFTWEIKNYIIRKTALKVWIFLILELYFTCLSLNSLLCKFS